MTDHTDVKDLYRQTVLEHSRHPRHFGRLDDATATAEGHNPLCGDKITVHLKIDDGRIDDVGFEGVGCAICMASASIMTEQVERGTTGEAHAAIERVLNQFDREQAQPVAAPGDMAALGSVRDYPSRIKCATLAWKTLDAALAGGRDPVTTED